MLAVSLPNYESLTARMFGTYTRNSVNRFNSAAE